MSNNDDPGLIEWLLIIGLIALVMFGILLLAKPEIEHALQILFPQ